MAERVGYSPRPFRYPSIFTNLHESRMNIGYFHDLACFNSFNPSA